MPRVTCSAKGENVDFDMLRIKEQMAKAPKSTTVKAREDFVDQKFKRRLKRLKQTAIAPIPDLKPAVEEPAAIASVVEDPVVEDPVVEDPKPTRKIKKKLKTISKD